MSQWAIELALLVASYLVGSVPFGLLIAKIYGVDNLRGQGSGNIGATNVARVIGFWPAGFLTFLLDALKGLLILAPIRFGWIPEGLVPNSNAFLWSIGLAAMVGHCFSPWLKFNGGKGVATTFGVIALLAPFSGIVGGIVFGLTYLATRVGAAGSLLGLIAAISVHRIFYPFEPAMLVFGLMVFVAVYRHESNLDGLLAKKAEAPDANSRS
jgi:glycerol-3-phosphate acyltransferase PlsY